MEQFTATIQVTELESIIQALRSSKHFEDQALSLPVHDMAKEHAYRASAALMEHIATMLQAIAEEADTARARLEIQVATTAAARKVAKKQGLEQANN